MVIILLIAQHGVYVLIVIFSEVGTGLLFAHECASYVVTAIGYALYLAHNAKHGADAQLGIIAQSAVNHLVQVVGYLYLHAVAYVLIFAYASVYLIEFRSSGLGVEQLLHHAEHAFNPLGIHYNLPLSLGNVKLCRVEQTTRYVAQLKLVVLFVVAFQYVVYHLHIGLGEPYHHKKVDDVEHGVEQ